MSGILTRFPCSANKNACPIARVAHLPQKPCYSVVYMHALFLARKKTSPAQLNAKQKKPWFSIIFDFIARKKYRTIGLVGWLVGWLVGCKNCADYLHFCIHLPYLRTFPFQNLHPYLTAIRGDCKVWFLGLMGEFLREGLLDSRVSNFVGIRRNFPRGKSQYMYCIYFHVMLLLSYRFCMNQSTRAGSEMEKKYG